METSDGNSTATCACQACYAGFYINSTTQACDICLVFNAADSGLIFAGPRIDHCQLYDSDGVSANNCACNSCTAGYYLNASGTCSSCLRMADKPASLVSLFDSRRFAAVCARDKRRYHQCIVLMCNLHKWIPPDRHRTVFLPDMFGFSTIPARSYLFTVCTGGLENCFNETSTGGITNDCQCAACYTGYYINGTSMQCNACEIEVQFDQQLFSLSQAI